MTPAPNNASRTGSPIDILRAAVDELVAKDVEPVEHQAQDLDGIPRPQGSRESTLRGPESFLPVLVPADTVVVLPERIEHKAVVQKHPDGSRKVVPYGVVHPMAGIESHHLSEVARERGALPGRRVVKLLFIRVGRVEADPQEDESCAVVRGLFRPSDPIDIRSDAGKRQAAARQVMVRTPLFARILSQFWMFDALVQTRAPVSEMRNTDDEAIVFCDVRFPLQGDAARVAAMLDGKTLREAAATRKGRARVIDWLKQLENTEHRRAAQPGHRPYDTAWLWRELEIEAPR